MSDEMPVEGGAAMAEALGILAKLGSSIVGIELAARTRPENARLNNRDVVEYLAEGGRDIRLDDYDAETLAAEFIRVVDNQLQETMDDAEDPTAANQSAGGSASAALGGIKNVMSSFASGVASGNIGGENEGGDEDAERKANAAAAKAFRAAGKLGIEIMKGRIEKGEGNDNQSLQPVSDDFPGFYATRRLSRYGIPKGTVLKASGFLLQNFAGTYLKLVKK